MAELDVLLSASLKRVAQPGDPAGVAEAIRARVAAGDTGAPAASSGFATNRWWMLWTGLGLILLLSTGGVLAVALPWLNPPLPPVVASSSSVETPAPTVATSTPTATPTPTASPTPEPAPAPPTEAPAEPEDTSAPVVLSASVDGPIFGANGSQPTISANVTDDRGATYVSITWSGVLSGSASMDPAWSWTLDVPPGTPAGSLTFTIQAVDAAGNVSAPYSFVAPVTF